MAPRPATSTRGLTSMWGASARASARFDAAAFLRSRVVFGLQAFESCLQYQVGQSELEGPDPIRGAALDAGGALTLTGPNGPRQLPKGPNGDYSASLAPTYLPAGDYTLSGAGGGDIGVFNAHFAVPPAPNWTNRDPSRFAQNFSPEFQWTLPGPANYMLLAAYGRNDVTAFYTICTEDPAKQTFAIPSYAFAGLVMHTSSAPGVIWIAAGNVARFDAPGLDFGLIDTVIGTTGIFIP